MVAYYFPTENNLKYFIEEHKRYHRDEKTVKDDDPKVIKEDDHTATRSSIWSLIKLLRLKKPRERFEWVSYNQ